MVKHLTKEEIMDMVQRMVRERGLPAEISWWNGPSKKDAAKKFAGNALFYLEGRIKEIKAADSPYEVDPLCVFIREDEKTGNPYVVIQFSTGGPSDEFRVYIDPYSRYYDYEYVEYTYLDWFVGVGFYINVNKIKGFDEVISVLTDLVIEKAKMENEWFWG